jgi:DNA polymerase IIIc chi subunit
MFNAALRDRYPDGLPKTQPVELTLGKQPPPEGTVDFVIDMRRLKHWRQ